MVDFEKLRQLQARMRALQATPLGQAAQRTIVATQHEAGASDHISDRRLMELDKKVRDNARVMWAEVERAMNIDAAAQALVEWADKADFDDIDLGRGQLPKLMDALREAMKRPAPEPDIEKDPPNDA